jgi:hypothetical protein
MVVTSRELDEVDPAINYSGYQVNYYRKHP